MIDRTCLVCGKDAYNALGIRCRRANTTAVWAPNLDAYLCDEHVKSGCEMAISYAPTTDGVVTTTITGPKGHVSTALRIGSKRKHTPGQQGLGF